MSPVRNSWEGERQTEREREGGGGSNRQADKQIGTGIKIG